MEKSTNVRDIDRRQLRPDRLFLPFVVLTAAYCIWVLSLPLFPSLDGPLHLYYASVLSSLLSGSDTFSSYYFIRHILPPYSLHYYFLIAAAHFVGYVMADKLLVCLIFLILAFGFRCLARFVGPSGDLLSLLIIPLLLNWPLGMGFYSYSLAMGMALWALAFWFRAVQRRSQRLWLAFLGVVVLMMLTHPVPLILLYVIVGFDVLSRFIHEARAAESRANRFKGTLQRFRADLFYMVLAWATIAYLFLFVDRQKMVANLKQTYARKAELIRLGKLSTLVMFSGSHPIVIAYRLSWYAILLLTILLSINAIRRHWANQPYSAGFSLFVCSLILLAVIPLLPPVINGANYFAQRLLIFVWIGLLAAASSHPRLACSKRNIFAACIVVYSIATLALANSTIRPVAGRIAEIETGQFGKRGLTGLTLSLPDAPVTATLNYVPYYWVGASYFRRSHSTLLNGGFLYEPYMPLGSQIAQLSPQLDASIQNSPGDAYELLVHSPTVRRAVLPHANLLLFTGSIRPERLLTIVRGLDQSEPSRNWTCESHGWYSDCEASFAKVGP